MDGPEVAAAEEPQLTPEQIVAAAEEPQLTPEQMVASFLNDISDVVNFHSALGANAHIGLLSQSAIQLAIQNDVKQKTFIDAMRVYFIKVRRLKAMNE